MASVSAEGIDAVPRDTSNIALDYGEKITFAGTVEPDVTFEYKTDYFLGDIVTVQNSYGVTVPVRIVEIIEVNDDNGYSLQPKFEYMS